VTVDAVWLIAPMEAALHVLARHVSGMILATGVCPGTPTPQSACGHPLAKHCRDSTASYSRARQTLYCRECSERLDASRRILWV
jgi:hypothetical protein